jgi:hypothetical protein
MLFLLTREKHRLSTRPHRQYVVDCRAYGNTWWQNGIIGAVSYVIRTARLFPPPPPPRGKAAGFWSSLRISVKCRIYKNMWGFYFIPPVWLRSVGTALIVRLVGPINLLLRWLYSPMWAFASLMDFSQSSPIDLTVPRPHLRFPHCWLFPGWGRQPHAQPPTWRVSIFISPGDWVAQLYPQAPSTHFSCLLRHAWVLLIEVLKHRKL